MTTTMNMLPNDHHPGPRCSCAECQRRYPEISAPAQPTSKDQLAFALERVAIYRTHKTILLPYAGSMIALADEIERLQTQNSNLLDALNAKQAKIDALMLEFCPGEMSAEQRSDWANSQQRAEFEPCAEPECCRICGVGMVLQWRCDRCGINRTAVPSSQPPETEHLRNVLRAVRRYIPAHKNDLIELVDGMIGATKSGPRKFAGVGELERTGYIDPTSPGEGIGP